jgi:hypothetical protein
VQHPVVVAVGDAGQQLVQKAHQDGQSQTRIANVQILFGAK